MKNRLFRAALLGFATLLLPLGSAIAYIGENPYVVKLSAPREVACGEPVEITARVRSSDTSDPAVDQIVLWDLKSEISPDDAVSPAETFTDDNGLTSAMLTFGQVEGERTVRVEIATWPTTIRISCVGAAGVASPSPAPSTAASAAPSPTLEPSPTPEASASIAPTEAPTAAPTTSTDSGSLTAAILPVALIAAVVAALGGAFLFLRRR